MGKIDSTENEGFYSIYPNGTMRWKYNLPNRIYSTYYEGEPTIYYYGNIYFGFIDTLYSLSWNGTLRWKRSINGKFDTPLVCDREGILYITTSSIDYWKINETIAISKFGNILWNYKYSTPMSAGSSPAITFNRVMIVPSEESGRIWAIQ
jgi:outer membrane protein assembly factor BamB